MLFFGSGAPPAGTAAADPRTVERWATDEYEAAVVSGSLVAQDINDVGGSAGYGRAKDGASSSAQPRFFGEGEMEAEAAGVWRRAHYECVNGLAIPWIWPLARAARAARRQGRRQAAASLRSCAEGGWWTQARLFARRVAGDAYCLCGKGSGHLVPQAGGVRAGGGGAGQTLRRQDAGPRQEVAVGPAVQQRRPMQAKDSQTPSGAHVVDESFERRRAAGGRRGVH